MNAANELQPDRGNMLKHVGMDEGQVERLQRNRSPEPGTCFSMFYIPDFEFIRSMDEWSMDECCK